MADDITMEFLRGLDGAGYPEAVDIVKKNAKGKLWLIGSLVYETLAAGLYGNAKPPKKFVFVVEKRIEEFTLPLGWKRTDFPDYWNPRFSNWEKTIDYVPLENIHSINKRRLKVPSIDHYLSGVPLTVQSMAFDIAESQIIGEVGIQAIRQKTVGVHNMELAQYTANKKHITVEQMIQKKAEELGFTPIYT